MTHLNPDDSYYNDPATGKRRVVTISAEISEELRDMLLDRAEENERTFVEQVKKMLEAL